MSRRVAVPAAVGVVALLAAAYFGYLTLRGRPASPAPTEVSAAVRTHRVVSRPGGFSVAVPATMQVRRSHHTLTLADRDRSLVVTVGRTGAGPLRRAAHRFVRTLRDGYRRLRVLGHQPQKVAGRPALATYGRAVNDRGVRLRFVTVTVRTRPGDYAITAFTAYHSDPAAVLPRVDAIAGSFRTLPRRPPATDAVSAG